MQTHSQAFEEVQTGDSVSAGVVKLKGKDGPSMILEIKDHLFSFPVSFIPKFLSLLKSIQPYENTDCELPT